MTGTSSCSEARSVYKGTGLPRGVLDPGRLPHTGALAWPQHPLPTPRSLPFSRAGDILVQGQPQPAEAHGSATGLKEALEKSPLWEFKRVLVTVLEIPNLVRIDRELAHVAFLPGQLGLPSSRVEPTTESQDSGCLELPPCPWLRDPGQKSARISRRKEQNIRPSMGPSCC